MKTKERELLERVVEYMWVGDIVEEIQELLTQPDSKREPLSNTDIKEASRNAKDMSFYNGVKWAERQHGIVGGER